MRVGIEVRATLRESDVEAAIAQSTWASVEYPEGSSFGEVNGALHQLRNFITLGVGRSVEPLAARGTTADGTSVEVHYNPLGARGGVPPGGKVHRAEMLFTLGDIHEDFGHFIGNWFKKAETLKPVYDHSTSAQRTAPERTLTNSS